MVILSYYASTGKSLLCPIIETRAVIKNLKKPFDQPNHQKYAFNRNYSNQGIDPIPDCDKFTRNQISMLIIRWNCPFVEMPLCLQKPLSRWTGFKNSTVYQIGSSAKFMILSNN